MASSFDEEIIEWCLDQDSLQNLLASAQSNWNLGRVEALHKVIEYAKKDLVSFYEDLPDHMGHKDIAYAILDIDYVDQRVCTWMTKTAHSIPFLNDLRRSR